LHNGGGSLWNWSHQLEHLARTHRVIAFDLLGFGASDRPEMPYTLEVYVRLLTAVLLAFRLESAHLIGHCVGASVALEFARFWPQRVRSVAVFNVCGGRAMLGGWLRALTFRFGSNRAWRLPSVPDAWLRPWVDALIYGRTRPELPALLLQQQTSHGFGFENLILGLASFDSYAAPLEKPVGFPAVLLVWGSCNRTLAPRFASVLKAWLEPERFEMLEGAGHMVMLEQPAVVNALLGSFLLNHADPSANTQQGSCNRDRATVIASE
jgi:(E)-2-((N-methylformamido)methylene)succinate hydrolase